MLTVILASDFCKERLPPQFDTKRLVCLLQKLRNFSLHNVRPLRNSSLQEWMLCSPRLVMVSILFNNSHFVQFYHREYVLDFGVFVIFEILVNFNQLDLLSAFFSFGECKFKCISLSRLCNSPPCSHLQVCLSLL